MIAILLCGLARLTAPTQTVDLIEINHLYSNTGCHVFSQVIFWDVDPPTRRFHVREWCMIDSVDMDVTPQGYMRARYKADGMYVVGRMVRESWTQTDPEREDVKVWPLEWRVPLARRLDAR